MTRAVFTLASLLASSFLFSARATPPFSIQQENGISWLAKPDGERFFSLGVCCVNQGQSREKFNSANPAYAAFRYYK
ncbi:MAG TPA: hypothetical protein VFB72_04280, partial [Verrucomicrobiae bacterium]|nr:hypothetical protein [Verrucomicrobiae bacterium]